MLRSGRDDKSSEPFEKGRHLVAHGGLRVDDEWERREPGPAVRAGQGPARREDLCAADRQGHGRANAPRQVEGPVRRRLRAASHARAPRRARAAIQLPSRPPRRRAPRAGSRTLQLAHPLELGAHLAPRVAARQQVAAAALHATTRARARRGRRRGGVRRCGAHARAARAARGREWHHSARTSTTCARLATAHTPAPAESLTRRTACARRRAAPPACRAAGPPRRRAGRRPVPATPRTPGRRRAAVQRRVDRCGHTRRARARASAAAPSAPAPGARALTRARARKTCSRLAPPLARCRPRARAHVYMRSPPRARPRASRVRPPAQSSSV